MFLRGTAEVRLLSPAGGREVAATEILDSLQDLSTLSSLMFEWAGGRLAEQRAQLAALSSRLSAAAAQVSLIQGRAIRVLSPPKYPPVCPTERNDHHHQHLLTSVPLSHEAPPLRSPLSSSLTFHPPPIKHPDDLLLCFHVSQARGPPTHSPPHPFGLGNPSSALLTLHSFILFNATEKPYEDYRVRGVPASSRSLSIPPPEHFQPAVQTDPPRPPPTEDQPLLQARRAPEDFYYYPSTLQIPDINVPDSLPDLPGVAESLEPVSEEPSFYSPFPFSTHPPNKPQEVLSSPLCSGTGRVQVVELQPHISVPPSPLAKREIRDVEPPPPPPPPPPPLTTDLRQVQPQTQTARTGAKSSGEGGTGEDRSTLMEAIRQAGGAGKAILKSAKDRKHEAKKKKQEDKNVSATQSTDGGLMSDLKNMLAMRRKGISGMQGGGGRPTQTAGLGDIMQRLASTIPRTEEEGPPTFQPTGDGSDEDDWD